jgi:hypothetical protein
MLRYIIMRDEPYEGLWCVEAWGEDSDPIPSYPTREAAFERAKELKLISPKGRINRAEILAIEV